MANYHGTLAAVRALGRAGVRVVTADRSWLAVSGWSRYAHSRMQAPSVQEPDRFVEWLLTFGSKHGRHVLLPTNDDTAWLYASRRDDLSRYFHLPSSSLETIYRLL